MPPCLKSVIYRYRSIVFQSLLGLTGTFIFNSNGFPPKIGPISYLAILLKIGKSTILSIALFKIGGMSITLFVFSSYFTPDLYLFKGLSKNCVNFPNVDLL